MLDALFALDPLVWFGLLSAGLSVAAFLPYIRDTIRRDCVPQRASWFIWSVLSSISLGSQVFEGATTSLWFAAAQVAGTLAVFTLSLFYGFGRLTSRIDFMVILLAGGGLYIWYLTENSVYALAISISVSLLGGAVTVAKAYLHPQTETLSTWCICLLASFFAILAVGELDPVLLAYPLYILVLNSAIVCAILKGRQRARGTTLIHSGGPI